MEFESVDGRKLRSGFGEWCVGFYERVTALFTRSQESIDREADEWLGAVGD